MKKLIILISICTFIACHKADLQPPNETETVEDYTEFDDSETDEAEGVTLETRGANFLISTFEPLSTSDIVPSNASRFAGYGYLDNYGGTEYKITGTGFGATRGTTTLQLKYKTSIKDQVSVRSWSNTEIVIDVTKFSSIVAPVLKNLSLKVIIGKDSIIGGVTKKVLVSKTRKCTGLYKDYYSYNSAFESSEVAYYPTSIWEVAYEQSLRGNGGGAYGLRQSVDTSYVPKATDLLMRSSDAKQYAIIQSVSAPVTSGANVGRYAVKVKERNYAGLGVIQTKTLYYKKATGFTAFRSEPRFTHYSLESGG